MHLRAFIATLDTRNGYSHREKEKSIKKEKVNSSVKAEWCKKWRRKKQTSWRWMMSENVLFHMFSENAYNTWDNIYVG